MTYTMEYIDSEYPDHSKTSCNDANRNNATVHGHCFRCAALEFRSLEWLRRGLPENTPDEEYY